MIDHQDDGQSKDAELDKRSEEKPHASADAEQELEPFTGYMLDYSPIGGSLS
jgi:hypothetical protein